MKKYPELSLMQSSAEILRNVFRLLESRCKAGVKTEELDSLVYEYIVNSGATPAFLGYHGFPKSTCISINQEVVHGIPSSRELLDGDVVTIDCGVLYKGVITDACRTYLIGTPSEKVLSLVSTTKRALDNAISQAIVGNRIGDISFAIQKTAEMSGYNVPRSLTGHAVGYELHSPPWIFCHGRAGTGELIEEGMYLAIEPILIEGSWDLLLLDDGWTVVTKDNSISAQFEETVYIAKDGPVVLTCDEELS